MKRLVKLSFPFNFKVIYLLVISLWFITTAGSVSLSQTVVNYHDCPCAHSDSIIYDEVIMPVPQKLTDYNGDGLIDLIRKEVDGKIYVYVNKGSNEDPLYREGILYEGEEIQFDSSKKALNQASKIYSWIDLTYDRFDVHIDSTYYYNNTPEIDTFFNKFEPRYAVLESWTNWSAEEYNDKKLEIYVLKSSGCYGGYAGGGSVVLYFSDPLYMDGCEMAYRENDSWYFDNPGELGDWWLYMGTAMHECTHAIDPQAIFDRTWLTEGFADYHRFNILSMYYGNSYLDINQETADTYIYQWRNQYNWEDYIANDYHDTSPEENEIQESSGYSITAWMFSMLRDDYSLPWQDFYEFIDNNPETIEESQNLGDYYTDTHVIDLFERAIGIAMYPVFRYDGPEGPGWGVRNWTNLDWYADLTPLVLEVSDTIQVPAGSVWLNATIRNNGDVGLNDVIVRFYSNDSLINEQTTSVDSNENALVSTEYSAPEGVYEIRLVIDEDNLKIETNDFNNEDTTSVSFTAIRGDANGDGEVAVGDIVLLITYLFRAGDPPDLFLTGDATCDGDVTVDDVVYLISYLFRNGPPPEC